MIVSQEADADVVRLRLPMLARPAPRIGRWNFRGFHLYWFGGTQSCEDCDQYRWPKLHRQASNGVLQLPIQIVRRDDVYPKITCHHSNCESPGRKYVTSPMGFELQRKGKYDWRQDGVIPTELHIPELPERGAPHCQVAAEIRNPRSQPRAC